MTITKYSKIKKLSKISKHNKTFAKILGSLPAEMQEKLTAKQLAIIVDMLYSR